MVDPVSMLARRALDGPSSASGLSFSPIGSLGIGGSDRPSTASAVTSAAMDCARPSMRMVTFSVDHPGGGHMMTTMSAAEFRAALTSSDPDALGGGSSGDAGSYNVKDILLKALGLNSVATSPPAASAAAGGCVSRTSRHASSGSTDLLMASALLEVMAAVPGTNSGNRDGSRTGATVTARSLSGTQDGIRFSIAVASATAAAGSSGVDPTT